MPFVRYLELRIVNFLKHCTTVWVSSKALYSVLLCECVLKLASFCPIIWDLWHQKCVIYNFWRTFKVQAERLWPGKKLLLSFVVLHLFNLIIVFWNYNHVLPLLVHWRGWGQLIALIIALLIALLIVLLITLLIALLITLLITLLIALLITLLITLLIALLIILLITLLVTLLIAFLIALLIALLITPT